MPLLWASELEEPPRGEACEAWLGEMDAPPVGPTGGWLGGGW